MKMKNKVTFEDVQSLCDIIEQQADIISNQNKVIINLHQVLAMHGIEIISEGEENGGDGNSIKLFAKS